MQTASKCRCEAKEHVMARYVVKTGIEDVSVADFLNRIESAERQSDARKLVAMFQDVTGYAPRIWGPTMIGFGKYAYNYDSGHSGEAMASGFAPRRAEVVFYIGAGHADRAPLLERLGKHKLSKGCLYVRHLGQIDAAVLRQLIRDGLDDLARRWPVSPT